MEIKVMVNDIKNDYYYNNTCGLIEIKFCITLSNKRQVELLARYDNEGKLIWCSSAPCLDNNPQYYIEIAECYKLIQKYEGNKIVKIVDKVNNLLTPLNKKYDKAITQERLVYNTVKSIESDYFMAQKTLRRLRKKENVLKQEKIIEKIRKKLYNVQDEYNKKLEIVDSIRNEIKQAQKIELI